MTQTSSLSRTSSPVPITFGTVGILQRQVRQLLNGWPYPEGSNERPVGFYLANHNIGVLPSELDTCAWMYLQEDSEDPVLVLPGTDGTTAVYVAASLTEGATLSALAEALSERQIELVGAGPGGATSHWLEFSANEAKYLDGLIAEHLDLCSPHNPDWLVSFSSVAPRLPGLCQHLNPALAGCTRHTVIALQGTCENHLRAVRMALHRCAS
jgi:hypothetical protein